MFQDIGSYIEGELLCAYFAHCGDCWHSRPRLAATCTDYKLLQTMNEATSAEYETMVATARDVNDQMAQLRDKCTTYAGRLDGALTKAAAGRRRVAAAANAD
jgi:hypothetical protein